MDLGLTLGPHRRGSGDPAYTVAPDGAVWRATTTPDGPGTLRVSLRGDTVEAEAWGPGASRHDAYLVPDLEPVIAPLLSIDCAACRCF